MSTPNRITLVRVKSHPTDTRPEGLRVGDIIEIISIVDGLLVGTVRGRRDPILPRQVFTFTAQNDLIVVGTLEFDDDRLHLSWDHDAILKRLLLAR